MIAALRRRGAGIGAMALNSPPCYSPKSGGDHLLPGCSKAIYAKSISIQNNTKMKESPPDMVLWFCLQTQPKREHIAAAHLRKIADIEVFSPRLRFKRPTRVGARWFEEAMFPGYLFARFQIEEHHKEVRSAMGITRILKFGDHYAKVDDAVVAMLRAQTGASEVAVINCDVREGDKVKIVSGALGGFEAVVTQVLSGRERVRLLLNFLGRDMHAEIGTSEILPARRHPLAEDA